VDCKSGRFPIHTSEPNKLSPFNFCAPQSPESVYIVLTIATLGGRDLGGRGLGGHDLVGILNGLDLVAMVTKSGVSRFSGCCAHADQRTNLSLNNNGTFITLQSCGLRPKGYGRWAATVPDDESRGALTRPNIIVLASRPRSRTCSNPFALA
jgi:hypothetical protein